MVIADELQAGTNVRGVATQLGLAPSTTSREVRRNRVGLAAYRSFIAEQLARNADEAVNGRRPRSMRSRAMDGCAAARAREPLPDLPALPIVFPSKRLCASGQSSLLHRGA